MSTATETKVDLDALERDAQARLEQAHGRRAQLALDALTDAAAGKELAKVEHQLGDCEHELQRIALARAERERRQAAARQAKRDERQQAAMLEARELQARREKAVKAIDQAAAKHVEAVYQYVGICRSQQAKLTEAGRPQWAHIARPFGYTVVDAAAVRNPENPDEPQRFIFWKAETARDDADPDVETRGPVDLSALRTRIDPSPLWLPAVQQRGRRARARRVAAGPGLGDSGEQPDAVRARQRAPITTAERGQDDALEHSTGL